MKIICEGIELSDSLMKVVKACATKTTTLILECVKLSAKNDTLTLLATDGEISIRRDIRAEVLEEGAVCVPGKYFADFIKRLENEQITLATDGSQMQITYGEAQSALQTLNADDFPEEIHVGHARSPRTYRTGMPSASACRISACMPSLIRSP